MFSENLNSYLIDIGTDVIFSSVRFYRFWIFIGSDIGFPKIQKIFTGSVIGFLKKNFIGFHRFLSVFIDFLCYIKHSIWKSVVSWRENQRKKNRSENGMKRTIWRGCIQLKMNSFLIEMCLNQHRMSILRLYWTSRIPTHDVLIEKMNQINITNILWNNNIIIISLSYMIKNMKSIIIN